MSFSVLKHDLELYITDTALKVSRSLYRFTTSVSLDVENFFPWLWGMGISDAILYSTVYTLGHLFIQHCVHTRSPFDTALCSHLVTFSYRIVFTLGHLFIQRCVHTRSPFHTALCTH